MQLGKQTERSSTVEHHAFGHAVVQQGADLGQLRFGQAGWLEQATFERQTVFKHALHPPYGQAAVVGNVRRLGGPGRHRAETRCHHDQRTIGRARIGITISQQGGELVFECRGRLQVRRHKVHKPCGHTIDLVVDDLQARQKLLDTETAESAAALELGDVQGHCGGLDWGTDGVCP